MATGSNKVRQINSFTRNANKDDVKVKSDGIFTSINRINEKVDYESVDYNKGSYSDTLKNLICEYITDLILDINSVKLEVFIGGVKNETLSENTKDCGRLYGHYSSNCECGFIFFWATVA